MHLHLVYCAQRLLVLIPFIDLNTASSQGTWHQPGVFFFSLHDLCGMLLRIILSAPLARA